MKKPLRAAFAPTRELYACTASLIHDSVAQDLAAWIRHQRATGPELDFAVGMSTDRVVDEFLAGIERAAADCLAAGETPKAKALLGRRLVEAIYVGEQVLADEDGFDRPGLSDVLGRLAYSALTLGMREARQYAHDHAIELARFSPPGDVMHYVAHGFGLMTDQHPLFVVPADRGTRDVCLVVSAALALGLEHLPGIVPAAKTVVAPLDEEERLDLEEDRAGIVRWRQGPPPRPRPKAEPFAKAAAADPDRAAKPGHAIVLRRLGIAGRPEVAKEIERATARVLNRDLRLVPAPDARRPIVEALSARMPHMRHLAGALMLSQPRHHWGWATYIISGGPGAGKTELVRMLGEVTGRPVFRYPADTSQDASFAGTPSRWGTTHPSYVLKAFLEGGVANPIIHIDELDKAAGSRDSNSGKLTDALTSLLDRSTASAWYDSYVQANIDASNVQFIITVNDVKALPSFLVDRCWECPVGEPTAEHLEALARRSPGRPAGTWASTRPGPRWTQ